MDVAKFRGMIQPKAPSVAGVLTVLSTSRPAPGYVRLRLQDTPDRDFTSDHLPAETLKLVIPVVPRSSALDLPVGPGADVVAAMGALGGVMRPYTLRDVDRDAATFEIDVLIHGRGPASAWAEVAELGWTIWAFGKRYGYSIESNAPGLVLLGDHTAIPAIAEILAHMPAGLAVRAVVSAASNAQAHSLTESNGLLQANDVEWLRTNQSSLAEWLRKLAPVVGTRVWAAGEWSAIREIRAVSRIELGLPRPDVELAAYWRAGCDWQTLQDEQIEAAAALAAQPGFEGNQYSFESYEPTVD